MKKISLILICLAFISCDFGKKQNKSKFDNISKKDTTCLNDIKEAKIDIQKGKLVYCYTMGGLLYQGLRSEKEAALVFKQNNIEFRGVMVSDLVNENQTHCYCPFMEEKIVEKYGEKFVDSLLNIADEKYLINHINDTMYYADCDRRPNYPNDKDDSNDDHSIVLQNELEKKITYPKGYIKIKNKTYEDSAFVDILFYVNKKGEAKIQGFWFNFDIKANTKFKSYLESEIKKYIKTENWTPAQIRGKNVNSDMNFRYELK
ncbi:MAG TPA: hypothetical protein PKV22_00145 [Paludibacteraceae bacterium]|nr:hypothetical protein [Paludibacteraceae bacterium]HQK39482.1 hypothetical protein [Flavobacterium alvei]